MEVVIIKLLMDLIGLIISSAIAILSLVLVIGVSVWTVQNDTTTFIFCINFIVTGLFTIIFIFGSSIADRSFENLLFVLKNFDNRVKIYKVGLKRQRVPIKFKIFKKRDDLLEYVKMRNETFDEEELDEQLDEAIHGDCIKLDNYQIEVDKFKGKELTEYYLN